MANKILVVVDMQNDFIDGALGTESAKAIVPHVLEKINNHKKADDIIFFTKTVYKDDYLETQAGKHLPTKHCIKGTAGCEIPTELLEAAGIKKGGHIVLSYGQLKAKYVIEKSTHGYKNIAKRLKDYIGMFRSVAEIELIGTGTSTGILANAAILKSNFPQAVVTVDATATSCATSESHETALKALEALQVKVNM